ncbi:hypothetical protein J4711_10465 [Staphylococcus epidermidis]|nr:hypothetical protein [Staphylococcus epidermidis]
MKVFIFHLLFVAFFVVDSLISLVFPIEFDVYTNLITAFFCSFYDTIIFVLKQDKNKNRIKIYNGKLIDTEKNI